MKVEYCCAEELGVDYVPAGQIIKFNGGIYVTCLYEENSLAQRKNYILIVELETGVISSIPFGTKVVELEVEPLRVI